MEQRKKEDEECGSFQYVFRWLVGGELGEM